jgi:ribosome-associated translation inhibitor RaiA
MTTPIQIIFRNTESSPAVTRRVETEIVKLGRYCDKIMRGRVVIEAPHPHHRHGGRFCVRIELRIPRHEIVVHHDPSLQPATRGAIAGSRRTEVDAPHKDVYVTIRDAFDVARRRLEDQVLRTRSKIKDDTAKRGMASARRSK